MTMNFVLVKYSTGVCWASWARAVIVWRRRVVGVGWDIATYKRKGVGLLEGKIQNRRKKKRVR